MHIFDREKNKTILISMIVSYLILFLAPIFLGVMGYIRMESVLEKNIQNFFDTKIELLSGEMNQCMVTLSNAVINIRTDDFIKEFAAGKIETDYRSVKKFIEKIDLDINSIGGVKYIGVYFKNSDIFVTNQGFFDSEQFYKILGETELTYDKWKEKYLNGVAFDRWSFPEASGENIIYTQSLRFRPPAI